MTAIDSRITAVTVYPDRARVTRNGVQKLEPGLHLLEFPGLPLAMIQDSTRVAARGSTPVRLLGLQLQHTYHVETPSELIHELEHQIEALEDELLGVEAREQLTAQARANLSAIASKTDTYAFALVAGKMSLEEQLAVFERLNTQIAGLDRETIDLAAQKRDLQRQLTKLRKELERWKGTPQREAISALVEVDAPQAANLDIELSYVVNGAGWSPLYDLRLVEDGTRFRLEVGYLAEVNQRTGEAWQTVSLTLSTARPALAARLPELDPWYIRPQPPVVPMPAPRMASPREEASFAPAAMMMKREVMEMEAALPIEAQVNVSGAAVTYQTPALASIPADGSPHKVTIARYPLNLELDYVTAPKLVEAAYRRVRSQNNSQYTLLPGQANLFSGDEFIGSTALELTAPQGEVELYLGIEDRVRVKRELKRREIDKKLIGSRRRLHYGYEIEVENLLPVPANLLLHDQLPVARHEDVKVRLETASPTPSEQSELNLLDWSLALAPGEKRVIRFDFSVEYPQDMELLGLP